MIFFSRKKKIQRDRNAGLVFRWRGGYSGNTGGLTFAIIMATSVFALAFLGIKVYVNSTAVPSRYRAEVILVDDVDPNLRWMLERNSPFFCAWEADQAELASGSIQSKMYAAIDSNRKRKINWRSAVITEPAPSSPSVYPLGRVVMPSVARHEVKSSDLEPQKLIWNYVLSSEDKASQAILPVKKNYALNIRPLKSYLGRTLQFTVHIDASGKVISALPLEWNTDDEMKLVENWVKTLQFQPVKSTSARVRSLVLDVSIQARKVAP